VTTLGNLTVTVELSTELAGMLSLDWSEPVQIMVRPLPEGGRATHEMIARGYPQAVDNPVDNPVDNRQSFR
jgi:hypothetical protein